jgi:hypothetical protein
VCYQALTSNGTAVPKRESNPRASRVSAVAKELWRRAVPEETRHATHRLFQIAMNATPHGRILRALGADGNLAAPGPLMLSGLLHESKGVSEGARLTLSGLRHAGLDPVEHDLRPLLDMQQDGRARLAGSAAGVWMLYANPPQATHAMLALDPAGWRSRRRVGYWTWELGRTPAHWPKLARAFHEIWVPSSFVADAFARSGFTTPVRVAPHAVGLDGAVPRRNRSKFAIPADVTLRWATSIPARSGKI